MPELPEVEHMTRLFARRMLGQQWAGTLEDPKLLHASGNGLNWEALDGTTVRAVFRRGKWMVVQTDAADMAWHFRMTGRLVPGAGARWVRARVAPLDQPERGVALEDMRRLGHVQLLGPGEAPAWLDHEGVGPEIYPAAQPGAWWAARFAGVRTPIKPALLDGARVAGIGNICASELLFRARIAPDRPTKSLTDAEWDTLAAHATEMLAQMVAHLEALGEELQYVNQGGDVEQAGFLVYGRAGQPCVRCAAPILRRVQGGRSTFWCGACVGEAP